MLQQQPDLGSPDVVSLSEGLSTSDGPTVLSLLNVESVATCIRFLLITFTILQSNLKFIDVLIGSVGSCKCCHFNCSRLGFLIFLSPDF